VSGKLEYTLTVVGPAAAGAAGAAGAAPGAAGATHAASKAAVVAAKVKYRKFFMWVFSPLVYEHSEVFVETSNRQNAIG
jgi:hypothetical protein